MIRPVDFLPVAQREVEEAFQWYEGQRPGLGFDFLLAMDATIERLRRLPEGNEVVALRTRKALLRRFPYLVLYALEPDRIVVTAVFHGRRNPIRWSDRVRERADSSRRLDADRRSASTCRSGHLAHRLNNPIPSPLVQLDCRPV
jgi:plasmid stabilization system protein ParE